MAFSTFERVVSATKNGTQKLHLTVQNAQIRNMILCIALCFFSCNLYENHTSDIQTTLGVNSRNLKPHTEYRVQIIFSNIDDSHLFKYWLDLHSLK